MAAHGRGRGAVGGGDGEVGKHCGTRARQLEELMGRGTAGGGGHWHGYSLRTQRCRGNSQGKKKGSGAKSVAARPWALAMSVEKWRAVRHGLAETGADMHTVREIGSGLGRFKSVWVALFQVGCPIKPFSIIQSFFKYSTVQSLKIQNTCFTHSKKFQTLQEER
jgi:hypothetical protein